MSTSDASEEDLEQLSNKELLERVAALDSETYPVADRADRTLDQFEEELDS